MVDWTEHHWELTIDYFSRKELDSEMTINCYSNKELAS